MAHPTHRRLGTLELRDKTPQLTHRPTPFLTGALGRICADDNFSNREEALKIPNNSSAKMSATASQSLKPRCSSLGPAKRFDDQDSAVLLRSSTRNGRPAGRCKVTASGIGSSFSSSSGWKRRIFRWHRRGRGRLKIQGSERYRRESRRVPTYVFVVPEALGFPGSFVPRVEVFDHRLGFPSISQTKCAPPYPTYNCPSTITRSWYA